MNGFRHTGVGNASSRTDYPSAGQVQDGSFIWGGTAGGTANALTISISPTGAGYTPGQTYRFIVATANTGAVTLSVNGQTAVSLKKGANTALNSGDLQTGMVLEATYDGTEFVLNTDPNGINTQGGAITGNLTIGGTLGVTGTGTFAGTVNAATVQQGGAPLLPPGAIVSYAVATAPAGYLLCNGAAVSRASFPALFAAIGTTFGAGDGSTTFNIPDLQGRTVVGAGTGSGLSTRSVGQSFGEESHVLLTTELPAHNHPVTGGSRYGASGVGGDPNGVLLGNGTGGTAASVFGIVTTNTGSATAHNTMQPSFVLNWIIKT